MIVLGIDPGIRGGLAIVDADDGVGVLIDGIDIPVIGTGAKERVDAIAVRDWIARHQPDLALIERAQAMPDPTTQPLCMVYAVDDGQPQLWLPSDPAPAVFMEVASNSDDWILVAHNSEFDCCILEHVLIPHFGFPALPLEVQHCSQRLALANAYPAELDLLAQALGLPYRKDPAARKAMLAVSRPKTNRERKATTVPTWDEDPAKLQLLYERCKLDVITTRAVWQSSKLKQLSTIERGYQLTDATINARGVRLDRAFADAAKELAIRERTAINLKLQELTHGTITSVDQPKRFLDAINAHGHNATTLNKRAVAQILATKPDDYVRQLLELRRAGARAAVNKFKRMIVYASPVDDRMRGTLRMYGAGPGRWSGLGPQLQNLKKNESGLPLSVVDSIRAGNRAGIAQYGNPLALLGDVSRAALCAAPGMELKSGDFSAIESVVLAWLAGEHWKLAAYQTFQKTRDVRLEPYRVIARKMLHKPEGAEVSGAERQLGKGGELAFGFGGSVGAWRRIVPHDPRSDDEIKAINRQWRDAHPATVKFWRDLARAIRVALRTGQPILVAPSPQPPIVAEFADGNLILTLPSGRTITYPNARLVPGKFEDGDPDVEFMDNARGQWKAYRGWFGTFVENVVQGTARDLLAAAIERFKNRNLPVVFHCHDEVTIEVPTGSLSEQEFLDILLKLPAWATGLPLGGKAHSGAHYLEAPDNPAEPLATPDPAEVVLEQAIDSYLEATRDDLGPIDDPARVERDDNEDYVANLADEVAPLPELVSLPLTSSNKVSCPFHDDPEPSCTLYPDHFHCFGCGEHGNRLHWLIRVEGMTEVEAVTYIKDWPGPATPLPQNGASDAERLAFVKRIWLSAQPLLGSIAEQYLDETRGIDVTRLPPDVHRSLRFHPSCVFGPGAHLPCLLALMRNPLTDAPCGIQRIALELRDGRIEKVDRRMLGHAGVVKIWPAGTQLVVGEGLETVLAAATRIPLADGTLTPAWAALSSTQLKTLPPIPGVRRLVLLVDNDSNQKGQSAAAHAALVWRQAGREVVELMPPAPDSDFNDLVLQEDSAHAVAI
jgi:DNA polymerase